MARRRGKPGEHLATDDYTGFTRYASELKRDFWGQYSKYPLERNLQEIAVPLSDPYPVSLYRGPNYEITDNGTDYNLVSTYVGNTTRATSRLSVAVQTFGTQGSPAGGGIGSMVIGTTFIVG